LAYGADKIIKESRNPSARADSSLKQFSENTHSENPKCPAEKKCSACTVQGIPQSQSFRTNAGREYQATGDLSLRSKNVIYILKCKVTGKMYIGMTTRNGNIRIGEHIRNITRGKSTSVSRHFNANGCYGQFSEHMEITPLASISETTMGNFARTPAQMRFNIDESNGSISVDGKTVLTPA